MNMRNALQSSEFSKLNSCEFCTELTADPNSRFKKLYSSKLDSRIVTRRDKFAVLPTLGQLFKGSLLVLPEVHFESFASLPISILDRLPDLVADLEMSTRQFGSPLLFEHGARSHTGSGCGIYHAHMHLVPVPKAVHHSILLPKTAQVSTNILDALHDLRASSLYLLVRDTEGNVAFSIPEHGMLDIFSSQFVRRKLVDYFDLDVPWDWREYDQVEPWLIETLRTLEAHVPFSR